MSGKKGAALQQHCNAGLTQNGNVQIDVLPGSFHKRGIELQKYDNERKPNNQNQKVYRKE